MKTIVVKNNKDWDKIRQTLNKGFLNTFKNTRSLFINLGNLIDRDTIMTFKNQGAWQGRPRWEDLKKSTKQTPLGTWKIRYGTDKNPKRTRAQLNAYKTENNLWYKPGPMKGYRSDRRYGANSKPLLASGSFQKSFQILKMGKNKMLYGTRHKLAEFIMSNPTRQALHYTKQDRIRYGNLIYAWINRNMKF